MNTFNSKSEWNRALPLHLRIATWLVVASQLAVPIQSEIFGAVNQSVTSERAASLNEKLDKADPIQVTVNRTLPKVQPPSTTLKFSENPSEEEISKARIFLEPLFPMGTTTPAENKALSEELLAFANRASIEDDSAITGFLERFPESSWRVALLTDLGIFYRRNGFFTKALKAWEDAWQAGKSATQPSVRAIANRAAAELAELNARLGRYDRLGLLFQEVAGREFNGPAEVKLQGARKGLWLMRNEPDKCFRCGPFALDRIRAFGNPAQAFDPKIQNSKSTTNGTSLSQVVTLASDLGMNFQMAKRTAGAPVVVPAVIHWKSGHFAALLKEDNGRYLVQDPTFTDEIRVGQAALDEEGSGYYLIPAGTLPQGWASVSSEEGANVWGKGQTQDSDPNETKCTDATVPQCPCEECKGMAQYSFHTMLVSLHITDTPVGYSPPRGPAVNFKVTYNQREAATYQPSTFNYANLGDRWTFDWFGYLVIDPNDPSVPVHCFLPGGGMEVYSGYNSGTGVYGTPSENQVVLVRISANNYERRMPDGSKQVFNLSDGASSDRKVFLTKDVDPAGNAVTYTFDGSFRIVGATDAIGQVTTFSYDLAGDSTKITKVTDPFGRFATFDYSLINSVWRLVKITDVIGIASEFTYSGNFITSLKTPYGTTTFSMSEDGTTRTLDATDPLGQTERLEARGAAPGIAITEPANLVPTGINVFNDWLHYRNSFYWDKKAWHDFPGDYTKAHIYHFLHTKDNINIESGVLESDKSPLEARIWRNYDGQANAHDEGTSSSPSKIARVLDDGTTQLYQFSYNSSGKVTQYTDPSGRVTTSTYAANGQDLTEVRQMVGAGTELLASMTYNSQHLPLTITDASGKTTKLGYNTSGQLKAITNALNHVILLNYTTNGYVTNLVRGWMAPPTQGNPNNLVWTPLATNWMSWDGYGRIRAVTNSAGYFTVYDYDAFDRPTKVTFPDGTFQQVSYRLLDPVLQKDRRGHWTLTSYDQLRRVKDVRDSLNRITHFEWCGCGSLESITDPLGRTTTWLRDLQGRPTAKIYPNSTQIGYSYETNTSRLKSVTDVKNQTTIYDYFKDDNLKQVTYSNAVVATPSVSFSYDTNYSRLATMVDGLGTNTYSYNAIPATPGLGAGRLSSMDGPLSNDTVTYFYDELGRMTNRAINSVSYTVNFDPLGRILNFTNALGKFTNSYVGASSRVSTNFYPNAQKTIFSYLPATNAFRVQSIQNLKSNGVNISKFDYTYDTDGQIATWTQQADAGTPNVWVMEYDPVDQLLGVTVRSNSVGGMILRQFIYGYDTAGNRTSEQIQAGPGLPPSSAAATHNLANQLLNVDATGPIRFRGSLSEAGTVTVAGNNAPVNPANTNFTGLATASLGTNIVPVVATDYSGNVRSNVYEVVLTNGPAARTLSYDLGGNTVSNVTATLAATYEWDAMDRLVAVNAGTNRSEFTYDGYGRRVKTVEKTNGVAAKTNWFVWCGMELCEERNNTGATVTKRFFRTGEQISGTNYFFTRDHLGSVREMMDAGGNIKARYDYDPYGRQTKTSGTMDADFGFTGHYVHTVSRLYLTLYRAYDPETARWLSRDPIGENGGLNIYAYTQNDPINWIDRLGLGCEDIKDAIDKGKDLKEKTQSVMEFLNTVDSLRAQRVQEDAAQDAGSGSNPGDAAFAIAGSSALDPQSNFNNFWAPGYKAGIKAGGEIYLNALGANEFMIAPINVYNKVESKCSKIQKVINFFKTGWQKAQDLINPPKKPTPYIYIGPDKGNVLTPPPTPGVYIGPKK